MKSRVLAVLAAVAIFYVPAWSERRKRVALSCEVAAAEEAGALCGALRRTPRGLRYKSFRGVPYAQQPLGELRFQELKPVEPRDYSYDATEEGPMCPQHDVFYSTFTQLKSMDEACIYANVHVPLKDEEDAPGDFPILVFIHGGGFAYGSGDADVYGPEYLVEKGVIVITFNYRLNVFGFLSLNSAQVPGNQGLRDMVALLQWVQRNARAFGGDPQRVTLGGQSAGAAAAHLLSLSDATKGLFQRVIMMSGTAIPSFYATTPMYAQSLASMFLTYLDINDTDPEVIHEKLIEMPLERIMGANQKLQDQLGFLAFTPVVESAFSGVKMIIDEDPVESIRVGRGNDISLLIGFTSAECESFRPNLERYHVLEKITTNPLIMVPPRVAFSVPRERSIRDAGVIQQRYFNGSFTMDNYIKLCSDMYYEYPALKVRQLRSNRSGGNVYSYRFAYEAQFSALNKGINVEHAGAGHVEDMTYVFRINSVQVQYSQRDDQMARIMTEYVANFVKDGHPAENPDLSWPAEDGSDYMDIVSPLARLVTPLTAAQKAVVTFWDSIYF